MQLLRKIGREVRPVMKGRGWTLPLLSEFSGFSKTERDSNLLGINVDSGKKICLRLRHTASDQRLLDDFLPFEDIVGTMLHELSHNVRGPHDDIFYKTLSELEEEWYEARRKGTNVGEAGFDGAGHRLGGWQGGWAIPSGVSIEELREKRRLKFGGVSSSGPQRLGGTSNASNISNKTPSQLAAEAARRRMQMKGACPSSKAEQEGAIKEQEEEEVINGIKVSSSVA
jgi:DNA-dependent metalloprotease WSS1